MGTAKVSSFSFTRPHKTGEPMWLVDQEITYQRTENDDTRCVNGLYRKWQAQRVRQLGSSMIGRIRIKAAPRNDPMIDPSPPMITMKQELQRTVD